MTSTNESDGGELSQPIRPSDLETIVDIDSQIQEDLDEVADYIDDTKRAKRVLKLAEVPHSRIYSGWSTYDVYSYKRTGEDGEPLADGEIGEPIPPGRISELRSDLGIDTSIVNPTVNLGLAEVNNHRFALAFASAYNDWLLERLEGRDNLVGNMVIAPHEPDRAAEEIDRVGREDSIVGIELPATGLTPPPGYRQYWPVYEAAQKRGLPISMHGVVGIKSFHQQMYSTRSFAEDYVNHPSFVQMRNIDNIVFEGIPEIFPDVDFVINGMGIGYAPYILSRMDDHYLELGYEIPILEQMPSKYFAESFYWSTHPLGKLRGSPDYTAKSIDMVGADRVMFGSDIPHPMSDRPQDAIDELHRYFDRQTIESIMGGTAESVYGL